MGIIYEIKCAKRGRSYFGQSKNIKRRFDDHNINCHNQHYSEEMQDDFNLFGEAEFHFLF